MSALEQEAREAAAVLHEFDAEGYSLSGKPLGAERILIVRMEDGRPRFTNLEPDGSLALGQLQLGAAAAEEILRLLAAATARDQEIATLKTSVALLETERNAMLVILTDYKRADREAYAEIATLRARVAELEAWKGAVPSTSTAKPPLRGHKFRSPRT